jgi:O-methyltransferase involved in polyketide biosynthesis
MTLYGRAVQSRWKNPVLRDPWAEKAIQHLDYDFNRLYPGAFGQTIRDIGCIVIATRAATFDRLAARYLEDHPDAIVLHLGCGMDSRVFRVDPPPSVTWFDVDYPDVIELRQRLYPERSSYHLVGTALEDLSWLDTVPGDRPALIVGEGVFPYLPEDTVRALLHAFTQRFPAGQLIFDAMPTFIVRRGSNVADTGASYKWALDDPDDLERLAPRLELVKEFSVHELVAFSRFPLVVRALLRSMEIIPALRRMDRLLVYRF